MAATLGFSSPQVCQIADVAPSTLDYWVRTKLVQPSLRKPQGRRWTRYWSVTDLITVRSVKALRDAGCPMQTVRMVKKKVEAWGAEMHATALFWDGNDVIEVGQAGDLRSLIQRPDQQLLHVMSLPLKAWRAEAVRSAAPIDRAVLNRQPRSTQHSREAVNA
ncbi:MAG: MerR family transcriptional regulator [Acidimicrobiales bacterium]|jgi:DNA-binding transcriptional MerR regulator